MGRKSNQGFRGLGEQPTGKKSLAKETAYPHAFRQDGVPTVSFCRYQCAGHLVPLLLSVVSNLG